MKKFNAYTLAEVLIALGVIGVVAAMTMPAIIKHYQKQVTVTRLKKAYSELYQAVNMSVNENTEVENWDYSLTGEEFFLKYLKPYLKAEQIKNDKKETSNSTVSNTYLLSNGTTLKIYLITFANERQAAQIRLDINGAQKPNVLGRDKFIYYIFAQKKSFYNFGIGDVAKNIPVGGLYPDGYGYSRNTLKTNSWRGCNRRNDKEANANGASQAGFCTALIMLDGWKIEDDYLW